MTHITFIVVFIVIVLPTTTQQPTTPPKIVSTIYFFRRHIENPCKLANIFIHEHLYNLNRDTTQSSKTLEQPHETPPQDPRTLLLARTQYYNVRTDRRLQHRDTCFKNRNFYVIATTTKCLLVLSLR